MNSLQVCPVRQDESFLLGRGMSPLFSNFNVITICLIINKMQAPKWVERNIDIELYRERYIKPLRNLTYLDV